MQKRKPVLFFLGRSGCGKDTQAEVLIGERKFDYVNSGNILRGLNDKKVLSRFKKNSIEYYEIKTIQDIINGGHFIPTLNIVCQWRLPVLDMVSHPKKSKGIVFVGSPRKLAEAMLLHDFFITWPDAMREFEIFPVEIFISEKEAFRRLLLRRQCSKCKKIFSSLDHHIHLTKCDACGGKLIRRRDDSKAGITERMHEYRQHVMPVLTYFRSFGKLITINGEQSIERVHADIAKRIKI